MPDNVVISESGTTSIKTDQLAGGEHVQYMKLLDGTADSSVVIATGTGTATNGLRVALADSSAVVAAGNVASGASDTGNPVKIGGIVKSSPNTPQSDNTRIDANFTPQGSILTAFAPRNLTYRGTVTLTNTTSTSVIAASGSASTAHDLVNIIISNSSSTATVVEILDGTTVVMYLAIAANGGAVIPLATPINGTANTAWNARLQTGVTSVYVFYQAVRVGV